MSSEIEKAENEPDKFAAMVLHYSHNAARYLESNDLHKASEMMWGAMSCVIKAVAAKKGITIKSHKDLGSFARQLSKMEHDKDIFDSFSKASVLHSNFYEANLDALSVRTLIDDVRMTVGRLMKKMKYRAP